MTRRPNGMFVVLPPFAYGDAITIRARESSIAKSIRVEVLGVVAQITVDHGDVVTARSS